MAKRFSGTVLNIILQTYRLPQCSSLMLNRIGPRCKLLYLYKTQTIRNFCSRTSSNNDITNNKLINKQSVLHNYELLSKELSNVLSIDEIETREIIIKLATTKSWNKLTIDDVLSTVNIALKAGVSVPAIKKNISLLIKHRILLEKKFRCLDCLNENINQLLPLIDARMNDLQKLIILDNKEVEEGKNKFRYLADELGVDLYTLCGKAAYKPILFIKPMNKIKEIMNVLKKHQFDKTSILNNLWLFSYNTSTIIKRSYRIKQSGIQNLKPWMVRCSMNGLHNYITASKKEEKLEQLYGSHVALISNKLKISESEVEFFLKRSPLILEIHLDKISQILDILLKYDYDAADILLNSRIFLLRTEVLQKRVEQIHKFKNIQRLATIYCSNKTFETYLKRASRLYEMKDSNNSNDN